MTTQAEAFAALAKDEANFAVVREMAAAFFALRDAIATEVHFGRISEAGLAAFAVADEQANVVVAALAAVDAEASAEA